MPHRGNVTARVRIIGLVSSFIAFAAIGLTLLVDHGHGAFGERVSRSERVFLLVLAVAVFIAHFLLQLACRSRTKGRDREITR